jgi:leucyl aminopeptidase
MVEVIVVEENYNEIKSEVMGIGLFKDQLDSIILPYSSSDLEKVKNFLLSKREFNGDFGEMSVLYANDRNSVKTILLTGLGDKENFTPETARLIAGKVTQKVKELGFSEFSLTLKMQINTEIVSAVTEGIKLANYSFGKYKTTKDVKSQKDIEKSYIIVGRLSEELETAARISSIISDSVNYSRDLGNLPPNECSPNDLTRFATELAVSSRIRVRVMEIDQLKSMGLNGIIAVGEGSNNTPKLILLEYSSGNHEKIDYLIVGKAVTFDTGGISLKPSEKMDEMKFDKCGGCNVIAIIKAVDQLSLPLNVIGIVPAVENMPSGSSYRPGDIIRMHNKKTVEIANTDAEGRIILADALSYGVNNYSPAAIIDMATLTGASIIALGSNVAALFGNDRRLIDKILYIAELVGEKMWHLPIFKEHEEQIKSTVADIKNIGGRPAGAITAAAFLSNFVTTIPWAHIDIAGTAWFQEGTCEKSYNPKGATGFGVRTILKLLIESGRYPVNSSIKEPPKV